MVRGASLSDPLNLELTFSTGCLGRLGHSADPERLVLALHHAPPDPAVRRPDPVHLLDPREPAIPHVQGPPPRGLRHPV